MSELNSEQLAIPGIPERRYDPKIPPIKGRQRLTARERAFALYYLETHKIGESAVRANYSPKHANAIGNRLIKKSQVAEFIKEQQEETLRQSGIDRTKALLELTKLAYYDLRKLYREDGSLKDPGEWDDDTAAAVSSLEVFEEFKQEGKTKRQTGWTKKVRASDKNRALEMLLKHLGLLVDKKEITGSLEHVVGADKELIEMIEGILN